MDSFLATPGSAGRSGEQPSYRYKFENAVYDDASASLSVDGVRINLEPRPLRLLAELLERVNEVVSKEELTENVWDGRPTVDNVFANAVTKLRKALGEPAASRIVTVPRIGYRLDGPVERTATGHTTPVALDLQPGQLVPFRDAYVLRQPLGAPAQGHVWLAAHAKLRTQRRVFKFAADSAALRRLKREFTLHRMLQTMLGERADIAQVLDANFNEVPYFLECEYGGEDLLAWSEGAGAPLTEMSRVERLALFLQVARAVAAAHSAGVLHKDLKPANVLVSGSPGSWQVKLTDFGSGRALDPERLKALGLTALGMTLNHNDSGEAVSGTVMYLAPELLAGQAPSMQSDVFSLGILLYQLLAGDLRRPMSTGWERDIDDELLLEDLVAATEGATENRIESAHALSERIARLEVRRMERLQKERDQQALRQVELDRQQRRTRLPWQIGLAVSLIAGLGITSAMYLRADAARAVATAEAMRVRAISEFMTRDLLQAAEISRTADGRVLTAPQILERASVGAAQRFQGQPRIEASVHRTLGELQLKMQEPSSALAEFEKAVALLQPFAESDPELLMSKCGKARALAPYRRFQEGERILHEVQLALPRPEGKTPVELSIALLRARIELLSEQDQQEAAIPLAKELVGRVDEWPNAEIADRFVARQMLAELYLRAGQTAEAAPLLSSLEQPPYSVDAVGLVSVARADLSRAKVLLKSAKYEEAVTLLQRTRESVARALGPHAFLFGLVSKDLANATDVRGDYPRATEYFREAHAAFAASMGEDANVTRTAAINIAMREIDRGDAEKGLRMLDELAPWVAATRGGTDGIDLNRAQALLRLGRNQEALERLSTIDMDKFAAAQVQLPGLKWIVLGMRGVTLFKLHREDEGRTMIRDAIERMHNDHAAPAIYRGYEKFLLSHPAKDQP